MTPQKQRNQHRPAEGVWGDCYRACIASILDLPIDEVPHFYHGTEDNVPVPPAVAKAKRDWFAARGLCVLVFAYHGDDLDAVLRAVGQSNPGVHYLLSGGSPRGSNHVVVCRDEAVVHDPAWKPDGSEPEPIDRPCDDGHYFVEFIGRLV